MGFKAIFTLQGSIYDKIFMIHCLICWGLGGIVHAGNHAVMVIAILMYPSGSKIFTAAFLMRFGLQFFCLWVPMGFLLNRWQMKRIIVPAVYVTGCCLAIIFTIVSLVLLWDYHQEDFLRTEFIKAAQDEIKDKKYPDLFLRLVKDHKCCGWYGPADMAPSSPLFDIKELIETDVDFMQNVAKCYGGTFTVEKMKGTNDLVYKPAGQDFKKGDIPKGCSDTLVETANGLANFLLITTFFVIFLTLINTSLYIFTYIKIPSSQTGSAKVEPSESAGPKNPGDPTPSVISSNFVVPNSAEAI